MDDKWWEREGWELEKLSVGVTGIARIFHYAGPSSGYNVMLWFQPSFKDYHTRTPRWTLVDIAKYIKDNPDIIGRHEPPYVSEDDPIMEIVRHL